MNYDWNTEQGYSQLKFSILGWFAKTDTFEQMVNLKMSEIPGETLSNNF